MTIRESVVERTGSRLVDRWRVRYINPEAMDTETRHWTRLGARLSRWFWR